MHKTKIDWPWKPLYTINPVVGCKRGCSFCYAHKMNNRFKWIPKWEELQFFPERLDQFKKLKKSDSCFINSVSDPAYWDLDWISETFGAMEYSNCENFLVLSKDEWAYESCGWPDKCQLGLTLTGLESSIQDKVEYFFSGATGSNKVFLSIEPLLGIVDLGLKPFCPEYVTHVIVGAESGPGATKTKPEWIQSVRDCVPENKIYWKSSMREYL